MYIYSYVWGEVDDQHWSACVFGWVGEWVGRDWHTIFYGVNLCVSEHNAACQLYAFDQLIFYIVMSMLICC